MFEREDFFLSYEEALDIAEPLMLQRRFLPKMAKAGSRFEFRVERWTDDWREMCYREVAVVPEEMLR